jgi:methionyl-tRNA formyltransferase
MSRIVFVGTSAFALPALQRLAESSYEIVAVYTQPDRPAGRGRRETPSPVKEAALGYGLPVFQPSRISAPEVVEELRSFHPDVIIAAAYGQILRQPVLDVPSLGVLNIHPSLLPRYRGASPVAAAILAGDEETGVTIMRMVLALDEGPILSQRRFPIDARDTTGSLTARLAVEGADLLLETLPAYAEGSLQPQPQDPSLSSYVSMVKKEDGLIDWTLPAIDIWRRVRAYNPWPGAFTHLDETVLRIHEAWPLEHETREAAGTLVPMPADARNDAGDAAFAVQTGRGLLAVLKVQKEGRRALPSKDFLPGERGFLGRRLA